MDTRNRRLGPWNSSESIVDAITDLENINVKAIWFESIASGTSGTFSAPTGGTIILNEWANGVDVLVSGEDTSVPNFEPVLDTEGAQITGTLDASGNWTISGVPADGYPISLIYVYRVSLSNFDSTKTLETATVEGPNTLSFLGKLTNELTGFTEDAKTNSSYSIADTTGVATVQPTGTQFSVWVQGTEFVIASPQTTTISKAEGLYMFYFDSDGVLQNTQTNIDDRIADSALVFYAYWNADTDTATAVGDERHGVTMDGATHHYLHDTVGARYYDGLGAGDITADGDGSSNTHCTLSIADGRIWDEDLVHDTADSGQTLTSPAQIPVWYQDGVTGTWRKDAADDYPVKTFAGGSSLLAYNSVSGSTWSQTEITSGRYVLCHIFCTNEVAEPVIAIQGQAEYTNIINAREGAETEIVSLRVAGLPDPEFVPLYTIIYQTSTGYSNDILARIRTVDTGADYLDWRFSELRATAGSSGTVTGPSSSTDTAIVRWDGTSGLAVQDSSTLIDSSGSIWVPSGQGIKDAAGASVLISVQGSDASLYHAGTAAMKTTADGISVHDTSGDDPIILFKDSSNNNLGEVSITDHDMSIKTGRASSDKSISLQSWNGSSWSTMLKANGGGDVDLYHNNAIVLSTYSGAGYSGLLITDDTGTGSTSQLLQWETYASWDSLKAGNTMQISAIKAATGQSVLFSGDPDGAVSLYYDNVATLSTITGGASITDGTDVGWLYMTGNNLSVYNTHHGGQVILKGETTGGVSSNVFAGDPDGAVLLYHNTVDVLSTYLSGSFTGIQILPADDTAGGGYFLYDDDNERVQIHTANYQFFGGDNDTGVADMFYQGTKVLSTDASGIIVGDGTATGTYLAYISDDFIIKNIDADGHIILQAHNTSDVNTTMIDCDPDADVELYNAGNKVFTTRNYGVNIVYDIPSLKYCSLDINATTGVYSQVIRYPGAGYAVTAVNASSATKTLISADPDEGVLLYYTGIRAFSTTASGIAVSDTSGTQPIMSFRNSSNNEVGIVWVNNDSLYLDSGTNSTGETITMRIWDGAAYDDAIIATQNSSVDLYFADSVSMKTTADGIDVYDNSGDNPVIGLEASTGVEQAILYSSGGTASYFKGQVNSMIVGLSSLNSSGTLRNIYMNPDTPGLLPGADSTYALGIAGTCWSECHVDGGTTSCSDTKYKTDRQQEALGLDFILNLVPVAYKFRKDGKRPKNHDRVYHGFFADEVEAVLRDHGHKYEDFAGVVEDYDEDGERWLGLKYNQFISPIVKAIQESNARIDQAYIEQFELSRDVNLRIDKNISELDAAKAEIEALRTEIETLKFAAS